MSRPIVLVADDDATYRQELCDSLSREGYDVVGAANPQEAREYLRSRRLDVAILDLHLDPLEPKSGWSGLQLAKEEARGVPIIILTGDDNVLLRSIPAELRALRTVALFRSDGLGPLLREIERALVPRVFLAHGRADGAKEAVARSMERLGLDVIVLQDEAVAGQHFLEALEQYSSKVGAAVVLLTADDEGRLRGTVDLSLRARQNVVFELGFFLAALGRKSVIALLSAGVEPPSDYTGIKYIEFDGAGAWKANLREALSAAGIRFKEV